MATARFIRPRPRPRPRVDLRDLDQLNDALLDQLVDQLLDYADNPTACDGCGSANDVQIIISGPYAGAVACATCLSSLDDPATAYEGAA